MKENKLEQFKKDYLAKVSQEINNNLKSYGSGKYSVCINISDYHMDTNGTECVVVPTDKGSTLLYRKNIDI